MISSVQDSRNKGRSQLIGFSLSASNTGKHTAQVVDDSVGDQCEDRHGYESPFTFSKFTEAADRAGSGHAHHLQRCMRR